MCIRGLLKGNERKITGIYVCMFIYFLYVVYTLSDILGHSFMLGHYYLYTFRHCILEQAWMRLDTLAWTLHTS